MWRQFPMDPVQSRQRMLFLSAIAVQSASRRQGFRSAPARPWRWPTVLRLKWSLSGEPAVAFDRAAFGVGADVEAGPRGRNVVRPFGQVDVDRQSEVIAQRRGS